MNFPIAQARVRSTKATARRAYNMKRLIEEMKKREMCNIDIGVFLEFTSATGVRNYVKDLIDAGIIESHRTIVPGEVAFYRVIGDDERIKAYLDLINPNFFCEDSSKPIPIDLFAVKRISSKNAAQYARKDQATANEDDEDVDLEGPPLLPEAPHRHFHLMEDDMHYSVRIDNSPPHRDPLVAALFGSKTPKQESQPQLEDEQNAECTSHDVRRLQAPGK